jgi:hypothetical protein
MKKKALFMITVFMILAMMMLTACSGTFSIDCSDAKNVHVEADKAAANDWAMSGSLDVEEGETVTMSADLEKGEIKIELFGTAGEQSIDEIPEEPDGEPVMTFMANDTDSMSGTVNAGSYMIKATVTQKATGTVNITASKSN